MRFVETEIKGVFIIDVEPHPDERGFFARTYCTHEFEEHGLRLTVAQSSLSFNARAGTLRGMHFERAPAVETKLIRCTRGAIFDAVADVRAGSPTFGSYVSVELTAANHRALYVPEGCAHGFQTLVDDTDVEYTMSTFYAPQYEVTLRFDDPTLSIVWPLPVSVISDRDRTATPVA